MKTFKPGYLLSILGFLAIAVFLLVKAPLYRVRAQNPPTDYTTLLAQVFIFHERLEWIGDQPPSRDESAALWQAFGLDRQQNLEGAIPAVEQFILNYPNSAWIPSLQSLLGQYYREQGRYTLALQNWAAAWTATQGANDGAGKRVADYALAHWLRLLTSLGRVEQLQAMFDQVGESRSLEGSDLQQTFETAKGAFWIMRRFPGVAYRCGTFAVNNVAHALYGDANYGAADLLAEPSPATGFSMSSLVQLSEQLHLNLAAVQRPNGNQIIVPSVVHWKVNHYAAIVDQRGDYFMVVDPTFGGTEWLSGETINAEASGYFLVPRAKAPSTWRLLTGIETDQILGRGYLQYLNMNNDHGSCTDPDLCNCPQPPPPSPPSTPPPPPHTPAPAAPAPGSPSPSPSGCASCTGSSGSGQPSQPLNASARTQALDPQGTFPPGMPTWYVSEPYMNLWLQDEPMSYQPSRGPRITCRLRFKQQNTDLNRVDMFNAGANWVAPWRSYIDATVRYWGTQMQTVTAVVHWLDGGVSQTLTLTTTSQPVYEYFTGASLLPYADQNGNFAGITVTWRDGSIDTYGSQMNTPWGLELLLSTSADPAGIETSFAYVPYDSVTQPLILLTNITDVDGNVTTLNYTNPSGQGSCYISRIAGPYGTVQLQYDGSGELTDITDAAQLTSTMSYGNNGSTTTLITPYGTNTCQLNQLDDARITKSMQITDPLQKNWLYLFSYQNTLFPNSYASSPTDPLNTLDNSSNQFWLSFSWNPGQYEGLSTTIMTNFTYDDFIRGRMRHWLLFPTDMTATTLSLMEEPSPDGTTAGQLTWYDYGGKPSGVNYETGTFMLPSVITQLLPDSTTRYTYYQRNAPGNITSARTTYTQSGGGVGTRASTYNYAANNIDLITVYGPNNELLQGNSYNNHHQVLTSTNAVGDPTSYLYDSYSRLTNRTLGSGLSTTYTYGNGEATNYLSQISDWPINRTTSFTWQGGDLRTLTDARGMMRTFTFDALHRLKEIDYPDSTYESVTYAYLDITALRDRLGHVTQYTWNADRQLTSVTDANTNVTHYGYCDCGALSFITNALTQVTTLNHDNAGRLTSVVYADNTSSSYGYNALDKLTGMTDHNGTTTFGYNNQGLLTTNTSPNGQLFKGVYDIEDRPTSVTDADGVTVTQTFDNLGELLSKTYPDTGVEGFAYQHGCLTAYTNQIGKLWQYAYDAAGRRTNEITPNPETITNNYNAAGDLLTLTDGKNQTTTWQYDQYGRVTNKIDAAGTSILQYTYDADGRLSTRWSKAKGTTSYGYDNIGNLLTVTYPVSYGITNLYDALNRLTNMVDAAGTTMYTYTSAGNLATETGPFASDTVTYTYHNSVPHLRIGLTLQQPSGNWSKVYGYDNGDRLKSVTSPSGTFVYTYNGAGPQIGSVNVPNATYYTNYFDSVGRQYWTTLYTSGGSSLEFSGYTYNVAGQRTKVWRAPDNTYDTITYDGDGQVQSCVGSGGYSTENLGYLYDLASNLNNRTNASVVTAFGVNNLNELTSEPNGTPTYDNNGNLTSESGGRTFAYDDENELTSVTSGTSYRSDFVYDGLGRRRKELDYTWSSGWVLSGQTWYIYDGRTVLQERDGNNNVVVSYTRGTDLSGSLQGAGGIGGLLARTAGASSGTIITSVNNGGSLRNDYSGWVGCYFVVGNTPLTVSALGRWVVSGNTGSHSVALCNAGGTQLSGGSVTVSTAGVPPGQFAYAALSSPITLAANTGYCLMTQETIGGDQWYDFNGTTVTLSGDASGDLAVYQTSPPPNVAPASSGMSYGPVNLQYSKAGTFSQAYYHADGNGSIRVVMSSSQGYLGSYLYDAYGNSTYTYDTMSPPNTYRFSSKEYHANSGLYYYGFRFYDPNLQRFLNRDPLGESGFEILRYRYNTSLGISIAFQRLGSGNLYDFVRNAPTRYYDSLGLTEKSLACIAAEDQAEAAIALAEAEPSQENIEAALLASMYAALVCAPPKPPPARPVCPVAGRAGAIGAAGAVGAFTGYYSRNEVNDGFQTVGAVFWDWWYGNPFGTSVPPGPEPYKATRRNPNSTP